MRNKKITKQAGRIPSSANSRNLAEKRAHEKYKKHENIKPKPNSTPKHSTIRRTTSEHACRRHETKVNGGGWPRVTDAHLEIARGTIQGVVTKPVANSIGHRVTTTPHSRHKKPAGNETRRHASPTSTTPRQFVAVYKICA